MRTSDSLINKKIKQLSGKQINELSCVYMHACIHQFIHPSIDTCIDTQINACIHTYIFFLQFFLI